MKTEVRMLLMVLQMVSYLLIFAGIIVLGVFVAGVFSNKTVNQIHQKISAGYGLITMGLLIQAIYFYLSKNNSSVSSEMLVYFAKNPYFGYIFLALIFLVLALIEYKRSLKNYAEEW